MKSIDFNLKLSPRKSYFMPLDCRFKYLTSPATVKSEDEKSKTIDETICVRISVKAICHLSTNAQLLFCEASETRRRGEGEWMTGKYWHSDHDNIGTGRSRNSNNKKLFGLMFKSKGVRLEGRKIKQELGPSDSRGDASGPRKNGNLSAQFRIARTHDESGDFSS